jgi:protein gp37
MAANTKIEWADDTWNVINGCTVVSPGCTNCYAMRLAGTRMKNSPSRRGLTKEVNGNPVWTGDVRFNERAYREPLSRPDQPRRIFVCAHGDLFHEAVPDEWIDRVFAMMALCPQHVFQVLTKRPDRMRRYITTPGRHTGILMAMTAILKTGIIFRAEVHKWPLPNVWLGTSVEDQKRACERVPLLLATPAAVRWISAEPLLGPVDLTRVSTLMFRGAEVLNALTGRLEGMFGDHCGTRLPALDWIVVGGESGPGARRMSPKWAQSLRDQCEAAGVAFLFKQWGDWMPLGPRDQIQDGDVRIDGETGVMRRVGKKAAGRLLDARQHDGYPA